MNESVLSILSHIQASNQQLADRLEKLERRHSDAFVSAHPTSWPHSSLPQETRRTDAVDELLIFQPQATAQMSQQNVPQNAASPVSGQKQESNPKASSTNLPRDAIIPGLDSLRKLPNVSKAVSSILASYEQQARHESLQGKKSRRSGRYNNFDTVSNPQREDGPTKVTVGQMVKPVYYMTTSPCHSGFAGQLTNILHIQNPLTSKQALTPVVCAMKDAVSLPFTAVKNEEGNLTWADSTQCSVHLKFH